MPDDPRTTSTPTTQAAVFADRETEIAVRPITARRECEACVALQHEIWGPGHGDAVPSSLLQVVGRVGGLVAGAFAPDGELAGFVFGLPAFLNGELAHWSHILGVRETARNAGIGRALKEFQRAELARRGIARIYWTYDPLVAKNAHLNLNVLDARVVEYVRDMYGTTASPLHRGRATDRLVVVRATAAPSHAHPSFVSSAAWAPLLTPELRAGDINATLDATERAPVLWLEVPVDIQLMARDPERAAAWHDAVRHNFEGALRLGYRVRGLRRDAVTSRAFYVLELHRGVA